MTVPETFTRLGLSQNCFKVYHALQKSGPMFVTQLIRPTKLYRPSLYRALHELHTIGLVKKIATGKRIKYEAAPEVTIKTLFQKTQKEIDHLFTKTSPRLSSTLPGIKILTGDEGIRQAFNEVVMRMRRGETFYRFTSEQDLDEVNRYLSPTYREQRDQKRLERLVISNDVSGKKKRPRLERFIKYLPAKSELFNQNIIELITDTFVIFIDLNQKQSVIIENPKLAEFQKIIFLTLYNRL